MNNSLTNLSASLDKSIFTDPAKYYPGQAYREAIDAFFEAIPIQNVLSIYQVGSIGEPGLSDIDLFLVMKNRSRDIPGRYSIRRLNPDHQYIFSHDGWLMNEESFKSLPFWFPYFELKNIYGKRLQLDETGRDNKDLILILLLNYLITKVPSDFLIYSCLHGQIYERIMIAMVNSLRHSLELYQRAGGNLKTESQAFLQDYPVFRSKWFNMDKEERRRQLKKYIVDSVDISMDLIKSVDEIILSRWSATNINKLKPVSYCVKKRFISFINDWDCDSALNISMSSKGERFNYPLSFFLLINAFADSNGLVGRHVKASIYGENRFAVQLPEHINLLLNKHVNAIETYAKLHALKFNAPVPGYHTYWASHTDSFFKAKFDYALNAIAEKLL